MSGPLYSVAPAHQTFAIGEPVWLVIRVDNPGPEPVSGSVLNAVGLRSELLVSVTDRAGRPCPDPNRFPPAGFIHGNVGSDADAAPGGTGELRLDLTKFAWLDQPGTYSVRLLAPFGDPEGARPDDPRWVQTQVVLVDPLDPAGLVARLPRSIEDQGTSAMDLNTWDALGHARYVPILEPLAAKSLPTQRFVVSGREAMGGERKDLRALFGLAACPCTEATAALVRLYDAFDDPERRAVVANELLLRIGPGTWFRDHAWEPAFADPLLKRARAALASSTRSPGWGQAYVWGAGVVTRIGEPADGALLAGALDRTLAGDPQYADVTNQRYGVVQQLGVALTAFPAPPTAPVSPDARLLLDLRAWDGRTGAPPAGWEALVLRGLTSRDPALQAEALTKLPPGTSSPALVAAVVHLIGSDDRLVAGYVVRAKFAADANVRDPLLAELVAATPARSAALLAALRPYVPLDELLDLILPRVAADRTEPKLVALLTVGLGPCRGGSRGAVAAEEVPRLISAWTATLSRERAALHAGPLPIVPGVTDPALVPASYECRLVSGETWPPR